MIQRRVIAHTNDAKKMMNIEQHHQKKTQYTIT